MKRFLSAVLRKSFVFFRRIYRSNNLRFEHYRKIFHISALLLSVFLVISSIYNLIKDHHTPDIHIVFECLKVFIELLIATYFFILVAFRWIANYVLDPMRQFFRNGQSSDLANGDSTGFSISSTILPDQVISVSHLADEIWGEEDTHQVRNRFDSYSKWHQRFPEVFTLVFHKDTPVGYICILPLVNHLHFAGRLSTQNIHETLIEPRSQSSEYVYIDTIYLKPAYQANGVLVDMIHREVLKKVVAASSKKPTFIYAAINYKSFQKYFKQNGFGVIPGRENNPPIFFIRIKDHCEIEKDLPYFISIYDRSSYDSERAQQFLQQFKKESQEQLEESYREMQGGSKFYNKPTLEMFFNNHFSLLDSSNFVIERFLGKTLQFYTHAVYNDKRNNKSFKAHFLAISTITFDKKAQGNFIACKFQTASKVRNKQYEYTGVCLFTKNSQDLLMIFHPEFLQTNDGKWTPYSFNKGEPPLILSGRVLKDQERSIIYEKDGLLCLHLTTYSQHFDTNVSKIGLLSLKDEQQFKNSLKDMFLPMAFQKDDSSLIKAIKSFLMKSNRVFIKGLDKLVVNSGVEISKWFKDQYNILANKTEVDYELYYSKNQSNTKPEIGSAFLKFFDNGVATLTRNCKESKRSNKEIIETYYGEINVRHIANGQKLMYIKFIEIEPILEVELHPSTPQSFRELYCILFWPEDSYEFDFTRGMLLGDRDIDPLNHETIIHACSCVVCNPNKDWKDFLAKNQNPKIITQTQLFHPEKLDFIFNHFLHHVFKTSSEKLSFANPATVGDYLTAMEIIFDDKEMCYYKDHFFK